MVNITITAGLLLDTWIGPLHLLVPPFDITLPIPDLDLLGWLSGNLWDVFMGVLDKMAAEYYEAHEKKTPK